MKKKYIVAAVTVIVLLIASVVLTIYFANPWKNDHTKGTPDATNYDILNALKNVADTASDAKSDALTAKFDALVAQNAADAAQISADQAVSDANAAQISADQAVSEVRAPKDFIIARNSSDVTLLAGTTEPIVTNDIMASSGITKASDRLFQLNPEKVYSCKLHTSATGDTVVGSWRTQDAQGSNLYLEGTHHKSNTGLDDGHIGVVEIIYSTKGKSGNELQIGAYIVSAQTVTIKDETYIIIKEL